MSSKKKLFAIIAAVAMLAGMLAFSVVPGVAATTATVSALSQPTFTTSSTQNGVDVPLGTILIGGIGIAGSTKAQSETITLSAPGGVVLDPTKLIVTAPADLPGTTTPNAFNSTGGTDTGVAVQLTSSVPTDPTTQDTIVTNNNSMVSFVLNVIANGPGGTGAVTIAMDSNNLSSAPSGPINIYVQDSDAIVPWGNVQVGTVVTGGTTTVVQSTATIAQGSTSTPGAVTINISENTPGSLENGGYMKIKLPSYFNWYGSFGVHPAGAWDKVAAVPNSGSNREVDLYFPMKVNGSWYSYDPGTGLWDTPDSGYINTEPGVVQITGTIQAQYNAPLGNIVATVGGVNNTGVTATSITVGTCGNYGATSTAGTGSVVVGQAGQTLPTFTISETTPGTLLFGRSLQFQLPSGVYWVPGSYPQPVNTTGSVSFDSPTVSNDGSTLMYNVSGQSSGTAAVIQFTQGKVDVGPTAAPGPLNITVSGAGVNTMTVQAGTIESPVTATATDSTLPSVVVGQQGQKVSNFTITEMASGTLEQNTLSLYAAPDTLFANTPTVSVTGGNLAIGNPMLTDFNQRIDIPITTTSSGSTPGQITVSGLEINTDSAVPQGPVSVEIGGSALVDTQTENYNGDTVTTVPGPASAYVASVVVANVVNGVVTTPGTSTSTSHGSATFTVGASVYSVNGVDYVMDAAPYISNGRTFVPVRYLGDALGATVNWDASTQTVTLTKGSDTVTLNIGSTTETVNGTAQTMDVAPTIVNGRTMLPARWVAQAFGAQVGWNPVTQEVLIQY